MGENSKIAWTDHTFNPVWGCAKVSPGCDHCYAEGQANRFGNWWGVGTPRREFGDKHWNEPIKWNNAAKQAGKRTRVFCASMADVFDKDWPEGTRERLWNLIKATPHLDWIIVTKRIGNASKMLPSDWGYGYPNVWLLITVVDQEEVVRDVPKLLEIPAITRGLSVEPQLAEIELDHIECWHVGGVNTLDALSGRMIEQNGGTHFQVTCNALDWVICGAESGPRRRAFDLDWARSLRDQCQEAGVAFFLKQTPGGANRKGVIETPELDGLRWVQFPRGAS